MTLAAALRPKDPQDSPSDALAPLRLPEDLQLTPEQFAAVCSANPNAVLELDASGTVLHMTPTGGEPGVRNSRLLMRLLAWAERTDGWQVFDSSCGFRLLDGSVLSPDASLLRLQRWDALTPEQRRGFPPLCPDLVVELATYQANGAQLGWLLIPEQQAVEIWTAAAAGPVAILSAWRPPARSMPAPCSQGYASICRRSGRCSCSPSVTSQGEPPMWRPWFFPQADERRRDQNRS